MNTFPHLMPRIGEAPFKHIVPDLNDIITRLSIEEGYKVVWSANQLRMQITLRKK